MTQDKSPEDVALEESLAALAAEETKQAAKVDDKFGDQSKPTEAEVAAKAEQEAKEKADAEAKTLADEKAKQEAEATAKSAAVSTKPDLAKPSKEVAAIVALRKQAQLLHEQNILLTGQNQALVHMVQQGTVTQSKQQQQTAADVLAQIEAAKDEAADKVDKGEMTIREYEKQRSALERQAREIERQVFEQTQKQQAKPAPQVQEDLYLAEKTETLAKQYPFLDELTAEDLEPFHKLALKQAEREGNPIQTGPLETLRLRTLMLTLAAKVYQPDQSKPAKSASTDNDAAAQAALAAKLKLQADMPPDASKLGSGSSAAGMTEAEFERRINAPGLNDAQAEALIASLSPALREKLGVR
jgi:hypothetical protein